MLARKPIIGITPSPMIDEQPHATFVRYAMSSNYTEAVEAAGGVPIVIPPQVGNVHDILGVIDGLLLSGGGDVDPSRYGDNVMHPKTYGIHQLRDELELELAREAVERDIPVLCICRGIQVLNVALGGSLIQDVADQYSTEIEHRQQERGVPSHAPSHVVSVTPGSLLERTYEQSTIEVNSFHHQAIKDVAPDLEINGTAPDETVEAVSCGRASWVLGVQWHPEMMFHEHPEHLKPFRALVQEAARKRIAVAG